MLVGLDEETKGTVLLRAGVLTGWLGSAKQISGAQESAKNLITESIETFEALGKTSRVAEGQIELACCYWREGAFDEGRVWLNEALQRLRENDIEFRAKALLRFAIIEKDSKRFPDTHGWAFAQFAYDAASDTFKPSELSASGAACGYACHTTVAADDYIFTAYPKR